MTSPVSSRDFEILSAYLDGQLQGTARQRLEARLGQDVALREEYLDLQRMRSVLRSLPRVRAPRNFTLTPQMVGQHAARPGSPWLKFYPVLGFASALASLLFVLVILGDIMGFLPGSKQAAQPEVAMEAFDASPEVALQAVPPEAETGLAEAPEEPALMFAMDTPTVEEPTMQLKVAPEGTDAAAMPSEGAPELAQGAAGPPTEEGAAAAELAQPASFPTETSQPSGGGLLSTEPPPSPKLFGNETTTTTPTLTYTPTPPPTETPVPTPTGILPTMVEPTTAVPTPTLAPTIEPTPTQEVLALALPPTEEAVVGEAAQADQVLVTPDAQREFLPAPTPAPILTPRAMLVGIQIVLLGIALITGAIALFLRLRER